jgi:hypothetical protein
MPCSRRSRKGLQAGPFLADSHLHALVPAAAEIGGSPERQRRDRAPVLLKDRAWRHPNRAVRDRLVRLSRARRWHEKAQELLIGRLRKRQEQHSRVDRNSTYQARVAVGRRARSGRRKLVGVSGEGGPTVSTSCEPSPSLSVAPARARQRSAQRRFSTQTLGLVVRNPGDDYSQPAVAVQGSVRVSCRNGALSAKGIVGMCGSSHLLALNS